MTVCRMAQLDKCPCEDAGLTHARGSACTRMCACICHLCWHQMGYLSWLIACSQCCLVYSIPMKSVICDLLPDYLLPTQLALTFSWYQPWLALELCFYLLLLFMICSSVTDNSLNPGYASTYVTVLDLIASYWPGLLNFTPVLSFCATVMTSLPSLRCQLLLQSSGLICYVSWGEVTLAITGSDTPVYL